MIPFLIGLAVGVGSTCVGSFAVVVSLVRHAPRIEHERDGERRQLYVLPGQVRRVEQWPAESDGLTVESRARLDAAAENYRRRFGLPADTPLQVIPPGQADPVDLNEETDREA